MPSLCCCCCSPYVLLWLMQSPRYAISLNNTINSNVLWFPVGFIHIICLMVHPTIRQFLFISSFYSLNGFQHIILHHCSFFCFLIFVLYILPYTILCCNIHIILMPLATCVCRFIVLMSVMFSCYVLSMHIVCSSIFTLNTCLCNFCNWLSSCSVST